MQNPVSSYFYSFLMVSLFFISSCSNNNTYERLINDQLKSKPVRFEYNGQYVNDYLDIRSVSIMKSGISDDRGSGFASIRATYNNQNLDLAVYFGVGKSYDNSSGIYVVVQEPLVNKQRLVNSSAYKSY